QAQPEAVADAIRTRHAGRTVLVVGHSDTLHEVVAALGGPAMAELCESQYADLFVLVLGGGGEAPDEAPALIRARYGAPSPPPGPEGGPEGGARVPGARGPPAGTRTGRRLLELVAEAPEGPAQRVERLLQGRDPPLQCGHPLGARGGARGG